MLSNHILLSYLQATNGPVQLTQKRSLATIASSSLGAMPDDAIMPDDVGDAPPCNYVICIFDVIGIYFTDSKLFA